MQEGGKPRQGGESTPSGCRRPTNVDPRVVMYAIPANDESTRTAELVAGAMSIAGREGAEIRQQQRRDYMARRQAEKEQREGERAQREEHIQQPLEAERAEEVPIV